MNFKRCNGCGRNVSAELDQCPYCNQRFKKSSGLVALLGSVAVLGVAAFIGLQMRKSSVISREAAAVAAQRNAAEKTAAEAAERAAENERIEAKAAAERKAEATRLQEEQETEARQKAETEAKALATKAEETAAQTAAAKGVQEEKRWRDVRYRELLETYRKRFKDPSGREVTLYLSTGNTMKGTLKVVKPDVVVLLIASGEVEVPKTTLTKNTCVMCYREDYAKRYAKVQLEKEAKKRANPDEPET